MRKRKPFDPGGYIGRPMIEGDIDKAIIRRYIKRHIDKIAYCYEKQLLASPGIGGAVAISFAIGPTGYVQSSTGKGFDGEVASCVAGVIKSISFPAPKNGGIVQVNYPFNFHAAGQ
jgi:outer membrane biosynthesis protein TonB